MFIWTRWKNKLLGKFFNVTHHPANQSEKNISGSRKKIVPYFILADHQDIFPPVVAAAELRPAPN